MFNHPWQNQTLLVCVDNYENGVPVGQLYLPGQRAERFESLSQFLLRADRLLNQGGSPQSFTIPRVFAMTNPLEAFPVAMDEMTRGKLATFEMRVLFRQHASWQGEIQWMDLGTKQSFRSVLELITLMDSALRKRDSQSN